LSEPLLDYKQAAKQLGLKESTLKDWVYHKKFPYVKVGRRTCFKPEDITNFINANRVEAVEAQEKTS